jgi:hypothetical protein
MTQAYYLNERDRQHLQELSRQVSRLRSELGARQVHTGGAKLGNAKWKNTHSTTCPAGGIIKLSNIQLDSDSTGDYYYEGTRPDSTVDSAVFAINGTDEVAQDGYGSCTLHGYAFLNTSSFSGTVAANAPFSPTASSWLAKRDGFTIGKLQSAGTCLSANILTPCVISPQKLLGKADADIAKGSSGTVSIWSGAGGSESDTTLNVTAYALASIETCSHDWVTLENRNGVWYAVPVMDYKAWTGYSGSVQQALTHDASGCLTWVDIEECP